MRFIVPILIIIFLSVQPYSAFSANSSTKKNSTSSKAKASSSKKKGTSTKSTTPSLNKNDPFPRAAASYLVQVDGKTVWSHNADNRLPIASITKIMTALLVLENCQLDEIVTAGKSVQQETGTRLGLRPGDKMTVRDLLSAALIKSACDACVALADHVGGSETEFVKMMNKRVSELGLLNTHFQNAAGHDNIENYSTANDVAALAKTALKNPIFAGTVSITSKTITTVSGNRKFLLKNTNEMFERVEGIKGVKTGYTPQAGKCLVSLAERNGTDVLLVLLNSPRRWETADKMLEKALAAAAIKTAQR